MAEVGQVRGAHLNLTCLPSTAAAMDFRAVTVDRRAGRLIAIESMCTSAELFFMQPLISNDLTSSK